MNNNFILKDSDKIEFSVEGKGYIKVYPPLTDIEITPNKETQTFKNNEEYGYDHVTVKPIPENYIDPTGSLTIKENGVKNVRDYQNVVVDVPTPEPVIPEIKLQDKEITPTKSSHDIVADNGYDGLSKVRVNPIPSDYIKPTGTKIITENGTVNISTYENVNVNVEAPEVEIKLQDKEVIPTKEIQNIKADTDYDGLGEVTVNAIPDEYIIPDGMLPITENTTYDVRRYATVSASVHPTPTLQNKSITVTENGTQTVTADSGYDGLGEVNVTVEVEGSGGGKYAPQSIRFSYCSGSDLSYETTNLDTSNLTRMDSMFSSCSNITNANLSNFNTENVTRMDYMFASCNSLKEVNLSGWNTSKLTDISCMFHGCINLEKINLSGWDTSKITNTSMLFYGCKALKTLILDSPTVFKITAWNSFGNSSGISTGICTIYVPDNLIDTYKADTYWTDYSACIKGLSEYTG